MTEQSESVFRRPTQISIEQFRAVRAGVLPLCDRRQEFAVRLEEDGFSAFRPQVDFQESFCSDPAELEVHRRHSNELAKFYLSAYLGMLLPFRDRDAALNEHFVSPLFEEMLADAPHVDRSDPQHAWSVCEPCNWRREQLRLQHWEEHEQRFASAKKLVADQFYNETSRHKSGLGDQFGKSRLSRCKLFIAAAEKYGKEMGFVFDRQKSHRHLPTVVRRINDNWDLRWMLDLPGELSTSWYASLVRKRSILENWDLRWMFDFPRELSTPRYVKREDKRHLHASFTPLLLICGGNQPSPLSAKEGEILYVNYYRFAPEFAWGYCNFFDNDEMEVNVKAQLTLIGCVIDEITSVINANLG